MRILFLSTNLPIPPNNGQAIRTLSLIRGLRSLGNELTFVSFAPPSRPATLAPLNSYCETVELLHGSSKLTNMSQRLDYVGRIRSLVSGKPYSVERFRSLAMQSAIESQLKDRRFDLVICDSLYALVNVPAVDLPIGLNCHNVEHVILFRYAQLEKSRSKRWYARIEARRLREAERAACRRAAFLMACSQHDRDLLAQISPDLAISVVPNAVDAEGVEVLDLPETAAPIVLFQGGMDWYPNRDAVEFFAAGILPLIRSVCADVKFVVAGRNPPAYLVDKFRDDHAIEFTGTVSSMLPYLAAATVLVCPLRLGSGTRIKILEGCAAAKPVVSTTIGAEGLNLEHGKQILLADDPAEFARFVIEVLRDRVRARSIGSAARAAVLQRYSESAVTDSLRTTLSALTCKSLGPPLDYSVSAGTCNQIR
jgi:polysaccharide biosynthesis protein PslH